MLVDALILAGISTIGYQLAFEKLPKKIQKFLIKHALVTDFLTFIVTYATLGSSLTALTAGAMVALFTSFMLHVAQNKDNYQYMYVMRDWLHESVSSFTSWLNAKACQMRDSQKSPVRLVEAA